MLQKSATVKPIHPWLRKIAVASVPGPTTSLLEQVVADLLRISASKDIGFRRRPIVAPTCS